MRGILHSEDFGWATAPRFGGGGGGGQTTTVQKSDPWSGLQPFLSDVFGQAQGLDQNSVPQYYPGMPGVTAPGSPSYVPLNTSQYGPLNQTLSLASNGGSPALQGAQSTAQFMQTPNYTYNTNAVYDSSAPSIASLGSGDYLRVTQPGFEQGQGYLSGAIGGKYLNPATDPGFQNVVNTTLANTMPSITSSFTGAGRSDSGLASRAAAEGANDAVGNLMLQNYQAERQLQQGAAGQAAQNEATTLGATETAQNLASNNLLTQQGNQIKGIAVAPSLDQGLLTDLNAAESAGGILQGNDQSAVNSAIQQWNYNQMLPWNQLGMYGSLIQGQGNLGGTSTLTQPYYSNQGANAMSGLIGGGALGASVLPSLLGVSSGVGGGLGAGLGALMAFL